MNLGQLNAIANTSSEELGHWHCILTKELGQLESIGSNDLGQC
jgi:hypothetical protein